MLRSPKGWTGPSVVDGLQVDERGRPTPEVTAMTPAEERWIRVHGEDLPEIRSWSWEG